MTKMMNAKRGLLMVLVALLAAVGVQAETLRIATHAPLYSVDPFITMEYITRAHGYLVYDTLFALDAEGKPQPQMVKDWSISDDQLTWSFTLRPGLKWHDGTAVTAGDCVASLARWGVLDGPGGLLMADTESLKATGPDSFTITLRQPYPKLREDLAKSSLNVPFMMPARIATTSPYTAITDATGSGPYRFVAEEWKPGKLAAYVRNDAYVPRSEPTSFAAGAKIAHYDRIEFVSFADPAKALKALASGEVQFMEMPPMHDLAQLRGDDALKTAVLNPTGNYGVAIFNHQMAPFDNPAIRRAVLIAMDQGKYMSEAIGDKAYWSRCLSIFPCHTEYSQPIAASYYMRGNIALARKALADAGYAGSPVVVLDPVDSALLSSFSKTTVALLRELGMTVVHRKVTWRELREEVGTRRGEQGKVWNMFHTWWTADDLSDPMHILFSGNPDYGWVGWPSDPGLDALRTQFVRAEDDETRADLAHRIQQRIVAGGNFAVLGQFIQPVAFRATLQGLQHPFQLYYNLAPGAE